MIIITKAENTNSEPINWEISRIPPKIEYLLAPKKAIPIKQNKLRNKGINTTKPDIAIEIIDNGKKKNITIQVNDKKEITKSIQVK